MFNSTKFKSGEGSKINVRSSCLYREMLPPRPKFAQLSRLQSLTKAECFYPRNHSVEWREISNAVAEMLSVQVGGSCSPGADPLG